VAEAVQSGSYLTTEKLLTGDSDPAGAGNNPSVRMAAPLNDARVRSRDPNCRLCVTVTRCCVTSWPNVPVDPSSAKVTVRSVCLNTGW